MEIKMIHVSLYTVHNEKLLSMMAQKNKIHLKLSQITNEKLKLINFNQPQRHDLATYNT